MLQQQFAKILNTSKDNVDVFTVIKSPSNGSYIDVRFSAHGSPYYLPEHLNSRVYDHKEEVRGLCEENYVNTIFFPLNSSWKVYLVGNLF